MIVPPDDLLQEIKALRALRAEIQALPERIAAAIGERSRPILDLARILKWIVIGGIASYLIFSAIDWLHR